jgi:hypothetical protein
MAALAPFKILVCISMKNTGPIMKAMKKPIRKAFLKS